MIALFSGAGQQSIWSGLRRLHRTEVRLEILQDLSASLLAKIGRSFRELSVRLLPSFFFVVDRRLEISVLSPARLNAAVTENLNILRESRLDTHEDHSLSGAIEALGANGLECAVICATPGCALTKTVSVPAGIRGSRLRQSLEYLLEVETPFRRDHVHWGFRLGPKQGATTRLLDLVVVPRSVIDPVATALRERGISLLEISYRDDVPSGSPIRLARFPRNQEQFAKRLLGGLYLVVAVQIFVAMALPIIAQAVHASHLRSETTRLSRIASDLGGLQSDLEGVMTPIRQARQELLTFPSTSNVLRLLEAELGSETTVDRLSVRGMMIQMTGSTPNVGVLTERLEKSTSVKPKSITRSGTAGSTQLELFSVSLELVTTKGP